MSNVRERQLELCRAFVTEAVNAHTFISDFLTMNRDRSGDFPATMAGLRLSTWLGVVLEDVDNHNEFDDIREPGEFDDDQLRDAVREKLRLWDTGEYDPETMW
jgi:hypothetical protein